MKSFSLLLTFILLTISLSVGAQSAENDCVIPDSGPWPPCATGGDRPPSTADCVIPDSGPWPPCATGGGASSADSDCVIPDSGPWPPCATGGNSPPSTDDCVIPDSGPWPPCATGGNTTPTNPVTIGLERVADGYVNPVYLTHAGDNRLFVVEKVGRVQQIGRATPFLDISDRVNFNGSERGLLSIAFHPNYAQNERLFVYYTNGEGAVVISEFQAQNRDSERILLTVEQPFENHNGGQLQFGRDGYLYIGLGDGGAAGDPFTNGQNPNTLLGSILRIDVNSGSPYAIPPTNPYVGDASKKAEIWAIGLRNPWRFSFDRANGHLFIGDVGQDRWEEINLATQGGMNFGWNAFEGDGCYTSECNNVEATLPILQYAHGEGDCSVTGGYVYRGTQLRGWQGRYLYGDFCSGKMWAATQQGDGWQSNLILDNDFSISSFGEDVNGELYVLDFRKGIVYRMIGR